MAAMSMPFLKFYTSDWRADPRLKMCSAAARGAWVEMICLMHEATPYGHLLIHGQTPNEAQLASLTGIPLAELLDLIEELGRMAVFSRTKEGVIYSRKLVRMASRTAKARKNGKKGGNPKLGKEREKQGPVNLMDKGRDKTQIPESRSQSIKKDKSFLCDCFSEFWETYPHRSGVKKNRKGAESKFAKAVNSGVDPNDIVLAAKKYGQLKQVREGYARDPVTWLNQEGWADEMDETAASPEKVARMERYRKIAEGK